MLNIKKNIIIQIKDIKNYYDIVSKQVNNIKSFL